MMGPQQPNTSTGISQGTQSWHDGWCECANIVATDEIFHLVINIAEGELW